jgi:uncharacterized protein (DUF1499 family)
MTDSAMTSGRGHRLLARAPRVAALLAGAALLLVVLVPFGWRFGLWHYRLSFQMVAWAQDLALAAAAVAALGLVFGRSLTGGRGRLLAAALVVFGVAMIAVPFLWAQQRGAHPPINDITTDTENPPAFAAALPAREAEQARPAIYGGAMISRQQQAFYPDIAPLTLAAPPAQAFERALATARALGWRILASDAEKGTIEASDTTIYFGFTDDIVIRVTADGTGSRVDIRSHSRQGGGDNGVNAARVRKYLSAMKG